MNTTRKSYPSDVSDTEWDFLIPYLTLMREDAPQRSDDPRAVYALRCVVKPVVRGGRCLTISPTGP